MSAPATSIPTRVVERLGDFLYELAASPMDEKFPFEP